LQKKMRGNDYLFLANGYGAFNPIYAEYLDGAYVEDFPNYAPKTASDWLDYANNRKSRLQGGATEPLVIYEQQVATTEADEYCEAVAMVCLGMPFLTNKYGDGGSANRAPVAPPTDLPAPGASQGDATLEGDILTRVFANYTVSAQVQIDGQAHQSPQAYIFHNTATQDTIRRGGGWPRQDAPTCIAPQVVSSDMSLDAANLSASCEADYCSNAIFEYRVAGGAWIPTAETDNGYLHSITGIATGGDDGDLVEVRVSLTNCDDDCVGETATVGSATIDLPDTYYRMITVQASLVVADEMNFPVAVEFIDNSLRSIANGGHVYYDSGSDIKFTSTSNPTSLLDFQIEKYDPVNGYIFAWVEQTIGASKNTEIYMHYGDSADAVSLENPDGTWWNYTAVMHMNDQSIWSPDIMVGVTEEGTGSSDNINGAMAGCQVFDGSGNMRINDVDGSDIFIPSSSGHAVEAWVYITSANPGGYNAVFHHTTSTGTAGIDFNQITPGNSHNNNSVRHAGWGSPRPYDTESGVDTVPTGQWSYIVGVFDDVNNEAHTYVNGQLASTDASASPPNYCGREFARLGCDGRGDNDTDLRWSGRIDEFRFSNVRLDSDRIETMWNNYSNPGAFAVVGSEQ